MPVIHAWQATTVKEQILRRHHVLRDTSAQRVQCSRLNSHVQLAPNHLQVPHPLETVQLAILISSALKEVNINMIVHLTQSVPQAQEMICKNFVRMVSIHLAAPPHASHAQLITTAQLVLLTH